MLVFLNSPMILLLITSYLVLIQLFFQSVIDELSSTSLVRIILNGILILIVLRIGEIRNDVRICIGTFLGILGVFCILLTVYIRYFNTIPTIFTLKLLSQVSDVHGSVKALINPDQYALLSGLILCICLYMFRKIKKYSSKDYIVCLLIIICLLLFPWIKLSYDLIVSKKQVKAEFRTSASNAITKYGYIPYLAYHFFYIQSQLDYSAHLNNPFPPRQNTVRKRTGYNFLIIQIESLDKTLLDRKDINGVPITPVLNKLKAENIYYPNFYAQHSGGGSSDAEIAALSGLLPLSEIPTMTSHELSHLPSVTKILGVAGYKSYALHGNVGSFWNRSLAYKQLGFDKFFDSKYYSEWGSGWKSMDGVFLEESLPYIEEISEQGAFLIYMITLSLHGPYSIGIETEFNKSIHAENVYNKFYFQKAAYTDRELGIFLGYLKDKGILDNTIIIIFGDHTSDLKNNEYDCGKDVSENIPLIIIHPEKQIQIINTYGSHVDIAPTILDLAGLPDCELMFGRSLIKWYPERLFPIIVGDNNYIITPLGKIPLNECLNPIYSQIIDYCRSYFYKIYPVEIKPIDPLPQNRYLAHAMGAIDGRIYTNSKEAFIRSYNLGLRLMEVDFCLTKDVHWVCFHDGLEERINAVENISNITQDQFLQSKMDSKFSLLDIEGLFELMQKYPDSYIVTDIKGSFENGISYITQCAKERDKRLLKRIIPQIYSPEDLDFIRKNQDFTSVIFTLYRSELPRGEIVKFVTENKDIIKAVAVSETAFSPALAADMMELKIPLYVHTINSRDKMNYFDSLGAYGYYTDLLDETVFPVHVTPQAKFLP